MPKVTVLLAVYNGQAHLREAVESILNQSFKDFEFIIIDDYSTDETSSILSSIDDPRIRLIRNEENRGLAASLNRGISEAKGTYIARMDADDISFSDRLLEQVRFMDTHPDIGISGSFALVQNQDGKKHIWKNPTSHDEIKALMLFACPLLHPTVIMRTSIMRQNNLSYDESFRSAQDYELWSRAISVTIFANIDRTLLYYRQHATSITGSRRNEQQENSLRAQMNLYKELGTTPYSSAASFDLKQGQLLHIREAAVQKNFTSQEAMDCIIDKIFFSACREAKAGWKAYWLSPLCLKNLKNFCKSAILLT